MLISATSFSLADTFKIEMNKIDKQLRENINLSLSLYDLKHNNNKAKVTKTDIQSAFELAVPEIKTALQPFGFYHPKINAKLTQTSANAWLIEFHIEPHKPTLLKSINVKIVGEGKENIAFKQILSGYESNLNKPIHHQDYHQLKQTLTDTAMELGFAIAKFNTTEIRVYQDDFAATVNITLDTGPKFYFGQTNIQQKILEPSFVEKLLPYKQGDAFDPNALIQSQINFSQAPYFNRVEILAEPTAGNTQANNLIAAPNQRNNTVDIETILTASKPRKYTFGAGYGTDTGPRINMGLEFRRLNRKGHTADQNILWSNAKKSFTNQYKIPFNNVLTDHWATTLQLEEAQIADSNEESQRISIGISRQDDWLLGRRHLYLNFERIKFTFDKDESSEFLIPGFEWRYKKSDDSIFTKNGLL